MTAIEIVQYFNEQGEEVQLFTKGNKYALLSIEADYILGLEPDYTELDELSRYEPDESELQALFFAKFTGALDNDIRTNPQAFAKAEAKRLREVWADDADHFPIAEQWVEYLERMASNLTQKK